MELTRVGRFAFRYPAPTGEKSVKETEVPRNSDTNDLYLCSGTVAAKIKLNISNDNKMRAAPVHKPTSI